MKSNENLPFLKIIILFILIINISCRNEIIKTPPSVKTMSVTGITTSAAQTGGEIIMDGGAMVTLRGVCWGTNHNPTVLNNKTSNGTGKGTFDSSLSGLVPGTNYFVRAFAQNEKGIGYGNEISFKTDSLVVTKVAIRLENESVVMGNNTRATVEVLDQDNKQMSGVSVVWSSSNSKIANIDQTGKIITEYDGEVDITAEISGKKSNVKLKVDPDFTNWKTFFEPVQNGFPDLNKYYLETSGSAFLTTVVTADLNKDGKTDLVFHLWHMRNSSEVNQPLDAPVPNRLVALIAQNDGTLKDQTKELFGSSSIDLAGSASRKVRVADLNSDGYPDWVYSMNREDARSGSGDWGSKSVAVVSKGDGTYRTIEFGEKKYHHSVEILPLGGGMYNILLDNDEEYSYSNGSFLKVPSFPDREIGTYLVYSSAKNITPDFLFSSLMDNDFNKPPYLGLFKKSANQNWVKESIFKWPDTRQIDYVSWSGDIGKTCVISYNGKEFISGGFYESTSIRLYPTDTPTPIVHFATSYLTGGLNGRTSINSSETQAWSKLMAFQAVNGTLQELNVISVPEGPYNINFLDNKDLNGDGFDDLTTYPYINGAKPRVYLNNKNGRLNLITDKRFPDLELGANWSSVFADVDGDGINDLIFFPGNGCNANTSQTKFLLYKGRRYLQ